MRFFDRTVCRHGAYICTLAVFAGSNTRKIMVNKTSWSRLAAMLFTSSTLYKFIVGRSPAHSVRKSSYVHLQFSASDNFYLYILSIIPFPDCSYYFHNIKSLVLALILYFNSKYHQCMLW